MSLIDTFVRARPATWTEVEPGFFVANRAGEFVGYIDTATTGEHTAFDGTSALIGRYPALAAAQAAIDALAR